jgi:hypothetical protein
MNRSHVHGRYVCRSTLFQRPALAEILPLFVERIADIGAFADKLQTDAMWTKN